MKLKRSSLASIRNALIQALALIEQLEAPSARPLDDEISALLQGHGAGLSIATISRVLRRRRLDVAHTVRLMVDAQRITQSGTGMHTRWRLT